MEDELDLEEIREQISYSIKNRKIGALKEIFEIVPIIDIAEALEESDVMDLLYIFRVVSPEHTSLLFTELSIEQQEKIIASFSDKELIKLLENSFADDVVDSLEEFPANLVSRVLRVAPSDLRHDINQLLNYKENTAGSIMTTEYIEMKNTTTVKEAISIIRKNGREAETVYTIFVKDSSRTLVGTIDLDDLIFAKEDQELDDIMNRDLVTCNVYDDQEDVANMFKRYDLTVMAVVNAQNKIIGIITIDDVVDIIVEEASEDIARLNQVSDMDDPYLKTPVFKIVLKCLPWIIALMVLQVFSTMILSGFQEQIARFAFLSVFTPLIMDAGGNSGGQTTTMIVRSLSLDEFDKDDVKRVFWKEFRVASIIATVVGVFAFGWLMLEMSIGIVNIDETAQYSISLLAQGFSMIDLKLLVATLVGASLFVTIIVSRMVGCSLPFLAKLVKLDPAVMCGPLTTTIVDIISLLTYFFLWTEVFGPMLGF